MLRVLSEDCGFGVIMVITRYPSKINRELGLARINIDDKLFADPRFQAFVMRLGDEEKALGRMVKVFRMAQEYWSNDQKLIPLEIWDLYDFKLIELVDLAIREQDGIYVRGTGDRAEWLLKKRTAGRAGGEKSARVRKERFGSAVPINASNSEALSEAPPKHRPNPLVPAPALVPVNNYELGIPNSPVKQARRPRRNNTSLAVLANPDFIPIAEAWLKFAKTEMPWKESAEWTVDRFACELESISKRTGLNLLGLSEVLKFIEKDEFWRKNAISPFGLLKKSSKNDLRKIDNIITRMKTRQHRVDQAMQEFINDDKPFESPF